MHGAATTVATSASTTDSGSFVALPDGGPGPPICDFLQQDCPTGEKCVAYDNDGDDAADETQCVPVAAAPRGKGEPCTPPEPSTGIDDCDAGLTCSAIASAEPQCVSNCVSVRGITTCADPQERCVGAGGPLRLCVPACDPRTDQCGAGRGCYPLEGWLRCLPDSSGEQGMVGDACASFANVCKPGLFCASRGCPGDPCCLSFCDTADPASCVTRARCLVWTGIDPLPPHLATLGYCQP